MMGSMHTGLECHPERFGELGRFYAARAKGGAGLIITGGFAPNYCGRMKDEPGTFEHAGQVADHRKITDAVHAAGGRILLQVLHAGRYGYHSAIVAPSDDETIWLAQEVEKAGADCLSTGIGWHESTIPTIAGTVPHAAFAEATRRIRAAVSIPVTASNRINLPEDAERLIADGSADLISMARPFLADPAFVNKVKDGQPALINVCIACNQACLDHYFTGQVISCLLNPRAVRVRRVLGHSRGKVQKDRGHRWGYRRHCGGSRSRSPWP
jgi:2,4-dienoyl-CoA reductase-like NADH-dependent reductase (Old Yellow Enzyme family)